MYLNMKMNNLFQISAIIFLFSSNACKQQDKKEKSFYSPLITLSSDSSTLELSGLSTDILEELRSDSLTDTLWVNFFAVYEEPIDTEMRDFQPALQGNYHIEDSLIRFKPKGKFKSGNAYFSRSYTKMLLQDSEDLLKKRELFSSDGYIEYKFRIP